MLIIVRLTQVAGRVNRPAAGCRKDRVCRLSTDNFLKDYLSNYYSTASKGGRCVCMTAGAHRSCSDAKNEWNERSGI